MKRLNKVQLWLTRVNDAEIEVGELQKDGTQEIQNLCLGGYCSKSLKSSYRLRQKVVEKLQLVDSLKAQGAAFYSVAEWVPAAAVIKRSIDQPTIVGQQPTFDKVWRCIQQEDVGIIGIYGMGGVGKTTLLTQINNNFLTMVKDFDVVIWVTVSKDLQLQKIQEEIGKMLCLFNDSWNNKNLEDKAEDISKVLNKKKFVLLLDDIWERVDLTKVGVPLPDRMNASKVVFTTRFINVCGLMEAQKKFKVECLQTEEAWELFKMKVGENTINNHPDIPRLAKIMAEECDGLPIALITIGRAMVYKNEPQEWKHEIEVLRRSASKFQGMQLVYPQLKFSYDKLPDDKTRSCFLYCCLFPEDYKIQKRKLVDYWIGEGFLDENGRSKSQNEGYSIIGTLVRACLLEVENDYVKMHDVIRDMAVWIANEIEEEKENVMVRTGAGLTEAPDVRKWASMRRISLMENKIEDLLEIPTCPHLQSLFLNRNYLRMITGDFFRSMHSLRVLNLSNNPSLTRLPSGVSNLVAARHVDLSNTGIQELPEELTAMILSVLYCNGIEEVINIPEVDEARKILGTIDPFANLEILQLVGLPNFKCVFSGSLPFPRLKEIRVVECPKLDELPLDSKSTDESGLVIMGKEYWWQRLQWKDPATQNAFRPCFKSIRAEPEVPSHADSEDVSDAESEIASVSELQSRYVSPRPRQIFEQSEESNPSLWF
ncbi:Disease resistance protein [Melia azedarach]|uniref:Disease resistance protein n=1 Tax=Melia azedarach TaxID=155640 RepID=A0ACC1Y3M5_MELAZ|nr:Disease resistance protein [Melia azedarach]